MAGATLTTDALLLRSVDYRDADRIVSLLTWELGPVSALARGARRSRKRFGGSLEPCALLRVELGRARGDLLPLASAEVRQHFERLTGSLDSLSRAGAALRTLRMMLPASEPAQEAFADTVALFEHFDAHGSASHDLTAFQFRLLGLAGLTPDLEACGRCGRLAPPARAVLLDAESGRVRCRACGGAAIYLSGEARALLSRMTTSEFLTSPSPSPRAHEELRRALLGLAQHHLGLELPADPAIPNAKVVRDSEAPGCDRSRARGRIAELNS